MKPVCVPILWLMPILLLWSGCATTHRLSLEDRPECALRGTDEKARAERLQATRVEAERWLNVVEYEEDTTYDATIPPEPRILKRKPGTRYLALLSYPGHPDPWLKHRSFLYDDALALLWYSWIGDEETARGLANTLILLQNDDGSWGFGFDAVGDGFYNAAYVRNGAVAWASYAMAYYSRKYDDIQAAASAEYSAWYLTTQAESHDGAVNRGLIRGGRGRWSANYLVFFPDVEFMPAISEHQFDTHMALLLSQPERARTLARDIFSTLWLPRQSRFAVAATFRNIEKGRALDASGGWGALWLHSVGKREQAEASLAYTVEAFATQDAGLFGYRPYLDPIDGPLTEEWEKLIFVEGMLGVGMAAWRLGNSDIAHRTLDTSVELACLGGPGIPYANRELKDFPTRPAAAPTLWFLFLEREMRTGEPSPPFAGYHELRAEVP